MGLKASMIRFWNPVVVPIMWPPRLRLGRKAQSEAKFHMCYIGLR
jgi:hypothetical protein